MNKYFSLFILSIALMINSAQAQQTVRGQVVDRQNRPLEFVNIVAIQLPDSTFVRGAISNVEGRFELDSVPAQIYLVISAMGYQTQNLTPQAEMQVVLTESETDIEEVRIVAQQVKYRAGGYEINLTENNPLTRSTSVPQMLDMLPNVHVSESGDVNILYRPVTAIYLDGLRLQDKKELTTIPLDQIERVAIDYSTATSEGANARGGALHIYLKPQGKSGYYVQLNANTGYYWHYGSTGINGYFYLSKRWNRLTLRNTFTPEQKKYFSEEENTSYDKATGTLQRTRNSYHNWTTGIADRFALSFRVNPRHVIATSLYADASWGRPAYNILDVTNNTSIVREKINPTILLQWLTKYTLDINTVTTFNLSTDYLKRKEVLGYVAANKPASRDGEAGFWETDMVRVKPVFARTFTNRATLQVGGDVRWIENEELTWRELVPNPFKVDTKMQTLSPALFATYAKRTEMFEFELGLRLQYDYLHTSYPTYDRTIYQYVRRKNTVPQWGLYPSLSLMYVLSKEYGNMLMLQAERTTDKIPYSAIGNYKIYTSPFTYEVGNPYLRIPVENQVIVNAIVFGFLNFTLGGIYSEHPIYYKTQIDARFSEISYTQPANGKYQLLTFGAFELRFPITKWWMTKTRAVARLYNGDAGVRVRNQWSSTYNHNSIFNINKSFGAGLNINYEPTAHFLDMEMHSIFHVGGYLFKNFLNDQLKTRLEFVAYRKQRIRVTERADISYRYENLLRAPWATLSITYTFQGGRKIKTLPDTDELQSYEKTVNPNK